MRSIRTISVDVDVDLAEFSVEDLEEELASRVTTTTARPDDVTLRVSRQELLRIRGWIYAGKYEQACREIGDLMRDALGTAI